MRGCDLESGHKARRDEGCVIWRGVAKSKGFIQAECL